MSLYNAYSKIYINISKIVLCKIKLCDFVDVLNYLCYSADIGEQNKESGNNRCNTRSCIIIHRIGWLRGQNQYGLRKGKS